jgi:hypothetical protein
MSPSVCGATGGRASATSPSPEAKTSWEVAGALHIVDFQGNVDDAVHAPATPSRTIRAGSRKGGEVLDVAVRRVRDLALR